MQINRKLLGIVAAALTLLAPYLIMLADQHIESSQSLCPFKMLTGLPCPGCGITKSIIFMYRGDILTSLSYHIFGPVVIFFCIATIGVLTAEIFTKREYFNNVLYNARLGYTLGIVLASYHLTRLVFFIASHSLADILRESVWG